MKMCTSKILAFVSLSILFCLGVACSTTPNGRKQLKYLPDAQMAQMGQGAFKQMVAEKTTLPTSSAEYKKTKCISDEILKAIGSTPEEWQVEVFKDPSPNAFALPGKKIGIHTGMIELAANNDQLAAVIGHEVGHVLADHSNERASQQLLAQGGLTVAQAYFGQDSTTDQLILTALGAGVQFGVLLPYSRTHELEADKLGLDYMQKAGFDPNEAAKLWKLMEAKSQGQAPPEFLSTHPNSGRRAEMLSEQAKNMAVTATKNKPCRNL